jgi:hypothetical protein
MILQAMAALPPVGFNCRFILCELVVSGPPSAKSMAEGGKEIRNKSCFIRLHRKSAGGPVKSAPAQQRWKGRRLVKSAPAQRRWSPWSAAREG